MGMVVRTNTMALNAYRQLGMNNSAVSKSLEKLSSGFRINRAGDDAAGLAISEKMKAQIKGLETASANAQDGISLIQTAEGNLNEVHDMLNRMVELASKSANGTYTSQERKALQDEVDSLLSEIDRISQSANFNGTKLLNGTMGLNNDAIEIGATTAGADGTTLTGAAVGTITATHKNAGPATTEQKPEFIIDFADIKFTQTADGAAAGQLAMDELTIGGESVSIVASKTALGTAADIQGTAAADANTDATLDGAKLATELNSKFAVIGNEVFSLAKEGDTGVKFTWIGKKDGTTTDEAAKVDETTKGLDLTGNVEVTAKKVTGGTTIATENRDNCHLTKIKDAEVDGSVVRAGASLKLTADMIKKDATLKIGERTFTFVDKLAKDAGTDEIGIKDLEGDDLLKSVTQQFSNKGDLNIKKDGKDYAFTIGRGNGLDTIEIEEKVKDAATLATTPYGAFTEDELKAAFSRSTQDSAAKIELTLKDNDKLANKEKILVDGKEVEFEKGKDAATTLNNIKTAIGTGYNVTIDGNKLTIASKTAGADSKAATIAGAGLTLQIGDTADSYNKMNVKVADMSTKGLGINGLSIMNEASASDAIDTIKNAINTVSNTRAGMGALQNRLEHTINNLDVAVENLSAANSRIRDTDMADRKSVV